MRVIRRLALLILTALAPLSGSGAQTCKGLAAFQDGPARLGVDYQHSADLDYYRGDLAFGTQRSFYGGVSIDETKLSFNSATTTGVGVGLGYQFHWSDTPFQVCPDVTFHYGSGNGGSTNTLGFGGSLGYRIEMRPGFHLVPAAGIRWMSADVTRNSSSQSGGTTSGTETFLNFGMVLNRVWSFVPGVLFPSPASSKTRWTFGLSYNWGT